MDGFQGVSEDQIKINIYIRFTNTLQSSVYVNISGEEGP